MVDFARILAVVVATSIALPVEGPAQEPSDLEVVVQILSVLGDEYDRVTGSRIPLATRNVIITPVVQRRNALDTLAFARAGTSISTLPLNARLAPLDCGTGISGEGCEIGSGDVLVIFGSGRRVSEGWAVDLYVLEQLTPDGGIGGIHFTAFFGLEPGGWKIARLRLTGVT